jgi:hypothetical protein
MTATGKCYPCPRVITEIQINIHLAREIPDNTMYALPLGLMYDYLWLSPSEVEITPLHSGQNLGSIVID